MERHCGIVLRHYLPKKNKIALIDKKLGRIDGMARIQQISPGTLIFYAISQLRTMYVFDAIQIEDVPIDWAREDILFLHHVLELCYLFIPIGSCVEGIFDLLHQLYKQKKYVHKNSYKKIFLFKLLTMLGMHASHELARSYSFESLLSMSIDTLANYSLDLASEKALDNWLCHCIIEHAGVDSLYTIHFLIKNRIA